MCHSSWGRLGGQETPECFKKYTAGHESAEMFRVFMNHLTTMLPSYRRALNYATVVYSSNDETTEYLKKRMKNGQLSKLSQMTELCIDDLYLQDREHLRHITKDTVHIIVSGRLMYRKGLMVLFDELLQLKTEQPYIVDIYGDGVQREELKNYVNDTGLDNRVVFHGKVAFQEMQECYKNGDIYVLPSLRETTGTALLEAMANKLPVISFMQNGAKYVVGDDAGILVELRTTEETVAGLAQAIKTLIENPDLRINYGNNAYKKVQDKYTWSKRVEMLDSVYRAISESN